MKISGTHTLDVSRQQVWDAINDPAVLARTLPGCESLEVVSDDLYKARVTAGVASIRGTYTGQVELADRREPSALTLNAQGAGAPGTIGAEVDVSLAEDGERTVVTYDADAVVGGMIGGVGQRMLTGVSERMASEFFTNLERDIQQGPPQAAPAAAAPPGGVPSAEPGASAPGQVFAGSARPAAPMDDTLKLVGAFVLGAAVALVGVLVGRRTR